MPVIDITTDADKLEMTLTAEFAAPAERLWTAFTDPRQLERFWGPPGWPATFTAFEFSPGGRAEYQMNGPRGEVARGRWEFLEIDPRSAFAVLDSFVDDDGTTNTEAPESRNTFAFVPTDDGSRLIHTTYFASAQALQQTVDMGAVEGITQAFNQLDVVLQDLRDYAQGEGTRTEIIDDQHVKITRLIDGPLDTVWRAYTQHELVKRWLLGPDGWRMSVCEIDLQPGGAYRYAWEPNPSTISGTGTDPSTGSGTGEGFGFDGETLVIEPKRRWVTTEHMTDTDYPTTTNDLSFYEEDGATLMTLIVEYPDAATRDAALATGMTDGMEASFARLERDVL